jgi:hypothetical protein
VGRARRVFGAPMMRGAKGVGLVHPLAKRPWTCIYQWLPVSYTPLRKEAMLACTEFTKRSTSSLEAPHDHDNKANEY